MDVNDTTTETPTSGPLNTSVRGKDKDEVNNEKLDVKECSPAKVVGDAMTQCSGSRGEEVSSNHDSQQIENGNKRKTSDVGDGGRDSDEEYTRTAIARSKIKVTDWMNRNSNTDGKTHKHARTAKVEKKVANANKSGASDKDHGGLSVVKSESVDETEITIRPRSFYNADEQAGKPIE